MISSSQPHADLPGPRGFPLFGNLIEMGRDPLAFLTRNQREWGDLVTFRMGRTQVVQLSHPEHIQAVLVAGASLVRSNCPVRTPKRQLAMAGSVLKVPSGSQVFAFL